MQLVENLKWRYATKKFDASKKVSQEKIDYLKEAVQLAASSFGLQPYKVLEIKNNTLKLELKPFSRNQSQITDSSHLFVFCNYVKVTDADIEKVMQLKSEIAGLPREKVAEYGKFVKGKVRNKSEAELLDWTARQTYIALANAMNACAELHLDCTPIEGFEPEGYNEKLGLAEKGLNACVLLAVGYRHAEDRAQGVTKVRKPIEAIFEDV